MTAPPLGNNSSGLPNLSPGPPSLILQVMDPSLANVRLYGRNSFPLRMLTSLTSPASGGVKLLLTFSLLFTPSPPMRPQESLAISPPVQLLALTALVISSSAKSIQQRLYFPPPSSPPCCSFPLPLRRGKWPGSSRFPSP